MPSGRPAVTRLSILIGSRAPLRPLPLPQCGPGHATLMSCAGRVAGRGNGTPDGMPDGRGPGPAGRTRVEVSDTLLERGVAAASVRRRARRRLRGGALCPGGRPVQTVLAASRLLAARQSATWWGKTAADSPPVLPGWSRAIRNQEPVSRIVAGYANLPQLFWPAI